MTVFDNRVRGIRQNVPAGHLIGRSTGNGKAQLLSPSDLRKIIGPGYVKSLSGVPPLTSAHIFVGNASNIATDVAMSGDATIANTGAVTLANTAVTPATYGDATNVPQITVDSKGRLTLVANVPISGGGTGSNTATLSLPITSTTAISFASMGDVITPTINISATGLGFFFTTITSGVYKFGIAPYDRATNKITATPTYTATYTEAAGGLKSVYRNFASPVAMTAGSDYIIFMVRTDSTTTVSQTIAFASNGAGPGITIFSARQLASVAPTTSDTWSSSGASFWSFQMVYSL